MANPHHHQHIRARVNEDMEQYPHPSIGKRWLDRAVVLMGIGTMLATIPQVLEIWANQNAEGVSAITWSYYSLYGVLMRAYGVVHHERVIVTIYFAAPLIYGTIAAGAVIYG